MPVGPSPFSNDFSEWYSKKRHSKNKSEFNKVLHGDMRRLKNSLTGDVYMMPKQDYEELVRYFNEHRSELSEAYKQGNQKYRSVQTPADYIDYAFESQRGKKQLVTQNCDGGHIKRLTYNPLYMLLMVEFANRGDICVFFNLPANVASTLMYLAENNVMAPPDEHGRERHAVGVEFWNLVRVRGTVHETRYPFQYTKDMRTGMPFGRVAGSGVHGEGNKYEYMEAEPQRRRFDKKTGEEIIRETVVTRQLANMNTADDKALLVASKHGDETDNVLEWEDDELNNYFYEGYYNSHLGKVASGSSAAKALQKALQMYEAGADIGPVTKELAKSHLPFRPKEEMQ